MFVVTERDSCQEPDARQEDLLHDLGPCITFGRCSSGSPHCSFLFWIGVQLTEERYKFLGVRCFQHQGIQAWDNIILAGRPCTGNPSGSHGFEPYKTKWFMTTICQHGI
jgi:hypothetical protein